MITTILMDNHEDSIIMTNKELEIQGCKIFVCPNLKTIKEKGNDAIE